MKKLILFCLAALASAGINAQVKIGHNAAGTINSAAVLELSNDTSAAASAANWKALILPYVNFTSTTTFTNSTTWGISGSPTEGALVYNIGNRTTGGFTGIGAYVWSGGAWVPLQQSGTVCADPSATVGSTGCVSFTYQGQTVTYTTVRAADGHVWLQQNLGATQVATSATDAASYGHYFQWGRWDDGHQVSTSTTALASTLSANNPSGLGTGSNIFYRGPNPNDWWGNGTGTDTWTGTTISSTNGKDPCTALGAGWHSPTLTEWGNAITLENITNIPSAFSSNLRLSAPGMREGSLGNMLNVGTAGQYWTNTPNTQYAKDVTILSTSINPADDALRSYGFSVRCIK